MVKIKKFISIFLVISMCFLLFSCTNNSNKNEESNTSNLSKEELTEIKKTEKKAVWLSYYEISEIYNSNKSESEFSKEITRRFNELKDFGFNTVIVHCRAFSDAIYKSTVFPTATCLTGKQGGELPFDLLQIMIESAKNSGLQIEAWINPYRISNSNNFDDLAANNPAKIWTTDNDPNNDQWVLILDNGLYYNPAIPEVQQLIVNGVKEIVQNYDINAIHFDDYFYPTTSPTIDATLYAKYAEGGGKLSLAQWRCENVNSLIRNVYSTIKTIKPNVDFGISPSASISQNLNEKYVDLRLWATEEGYVDYICPQIYFGFNSESMPFIPTVKSWISLMRNSKAKLYFGLGLYKCNQIDEFADKTDGSNKQSPKYEFINNTDIISRQITYIRQTEGYNGFFIYSYSYLFDKPDENIKKEVDLIKSILN